MGGGVSSLPAEVSLAEAKELAGAKWQPAWEEKFAEAKISKDEAIQCWKDAEAEAAISEELYESSRHQPFRHCGSARLFRHNCREARAAPARHARVGFRGGAPLADRR